MLTYQHFLRMTDDIGMLQFSRLDQPDPYSGHTLDDNARALILSIFMQDGQDLAKKYLAFMDHCQQEDGSWSNLLLKGRYSSLINSEDSIGRALLALSVGASYSNWEDIKNYCRDLLQLNLPRAVTFTSPRAIAYTLLALSIGETVKKVHTMTGMAEYLLNLYKGKKAAGWYWFEDYMTYCNGILPQSMIAVYEITGDKGYLKAGLETLNFLNDTLFRDGYLNIIGNQGWYQRGQAIPAYDQQPVDAASVAFACYQAYTITAKSEYLELAKKAYAWYFGANICGLSLYNQNTGGCYDALTPSGVNLNQGAEAILSLLLTDRLISTSVNAAGSAIG